ncbi:MAG TPA: hypothetical protein VHG10_09240 [Glycomyces sp.]|nr:hypothetical protein [Glycomyces sp.]
MMILVQQPFYRHDSLGPGADLREITGTSDQAGFYDWAGRRLFLADGEPDPMCPGAYRFQHNPACCDLEASDSDPRSPRYEPMHLRHKPGDTWIIDTNRPYDPYDPGPYGSHGWYQDERTGRHRRDETPDPLPADGWTPPQNAWYPGTADWPEPEAPQPESLAPAVRSDQRGGTSRRRGSDHQDGSGGRSGTEGRGDSDGWGGGRQSDPGVRGGGDRERGSVERGGSDLPPPWGLRGRPVPSPEGDRPASAERGGDRSSPGPHGSEPRTQWGRRHPEARPQGHRVPAPGRDDQPGQSDRDDRDRNTTRQPWDREEHGSDRSGDADEFRFSKLREDAFDRFMIQSAQLRAAHFQPERPYLRERATWVLRWLWWVLACGSVPMPRP